MEPGRVKCLSPTRLPFSGRSTPTARPAFLPPPTPRPALHQPTPFALPPLTLVRGCPHTAELSTRLGHPLLTSPVSRYRQEWAPVPRVGGLLSGPRRRFRQASGRPRSVGLGRGGCAQVVELSTAPGHPLLTTRVPRYGQEWAPGPRVGGLLPGPRRRFRQASGRPRSVEVGRDTCPQAVGLSTTSGRPLLTTRDPRYGQEWAPAPRVGGPLSGPRRRFGQGSGGARSGGLGRGGCAQVVELSTAPGHPLLTTRVPRYGQEWAPGPRVGGLLSGPRRRFRQACGRPRPGGLGRGGCAHVVGLSTASRRPLLTTRDPRYGQEWAPVPRVGGLLCGLWRGGRQGSGGARSGGGGLGGCPRGVGVSSAWACPLLTSRDPRYGQEWAPVPRVGGPLPGPRRSPRQGPVSAGWVAGRVGESRLGDRVELAERSVGGVGVVQSRRAWPVGLLCPFGRLVPFGRSVVDARPRAVAADDVCRVCRVGVGLGVRPGWAADVACLGCTDPAGVHRPVRHLVGRNPVEVGDTVRTTPSHPSARPVGPVVMGATGSCPPHQVPRPLS